MLPELILLVNTSVSGIQARDSNEANMVTLSVQIMGAIPAVIPAEVSWMYASDKASISVNITKSSDIKLNVSNDIASLTITRVKLSHKGIYTALVNHPAGQVMAPSIELDVQGKTERIYTSCEYYSHRCQPSQNSWDSPGFGASVPCPAQK